MPSFAFGGEFPGAAQRYFRAEMPARALADVSHGTWETSAYDVLLAPHTAEQIANEPRMRATTARKMELSEPPDALTIRMKDEFDLSNDNPEQTLAQQITTARRAGQCVIYDLDDNYWAIPDWNPVRVARNPLDPSRVTYDLDAMNEIISLCDAVTVSTPAVAEAVRANTTNENVFVVRNGVEPKLYPAHPPHEGLRVGWMGSISFNGAHLLTVMDALDVLKEFDATFYHYGMNYGDWRTDAFHSQLPVPVRKVPWMDHELIAHLLGLVDIAIVPRDESEFTDAQSTSSGLQWAAAGVPVLATPTPEYRRLASLGGCVTASGDPEWREQLGLLLESAALRKRRRVRARQVVEKYHGLKPTGLAWLGVLQGLGHGW